MRLLAGSSIIWVGITNVTILIVSTIADLILDRGFYLALGIGAIAITTFLFLLNRGYTDKTAARTDGVRDAIACSFVLVYLILVIYSVFFAGIEMNGQKTQQTDPVTVTLLNSFTAIAATVIGFYFIAGSFDKFNEARLSKAKELVPAADEDIKAE